MAADGNPEVHLETGSHPNGGEEDERVEEQDVIVRGMGYMELLLQVELYADEENDSTEIKRIKRMARAALTTWKENQETHKDQRLRGKSEMRSIMNEVYQLVSLYSVFEGVVLTAVATSSRLECQHLWSPVGLSLFAYAMLVVVAFKKFRDIRELGKAILFYRRGIRESERWVRALKVRGYANFDYDRDCKVPLYGKVNIPLWRNALALIVPLTIFTTGLVFSLIHILCWN